MPEVEILDAPATKGTEPIQGERRFAKVGRSAERRQKALLAKQKQLHRETRQNADGLWEGPLRPCTLINFNPVPLVMEIEGRRLTVPAAGTGPERGRVTLPWRGRTYQGRYLVLTSPILYTAVTGHEVDEILANIDVPKTEVRYFSPHAIGCAFVEQYNSPSHKLMGGVLLFDQDIRALEKERLRRTDGKIHVPERVLIEDSLEWTYTLRETTLDEELARIFQAQLDYANVVIQKAHSLWTTNNSEEQKMITDTDREWDRWAVNMGFAESLAAWVTAKIVVGGAVVDLPKCRYCQKQAVDAGALFCPGCNAPYDAYAAFKAGLVVPEQYLELLEGKQLEEVRRTLAARRGRLQTSPQEQQAAQATAKPLTGAAKAAAEKKAAQQGGGEKK